MQSQYVNIDPYRLDCTKKKSFYTQIYSICLARSQFYNLSIESTIEGFLNISFYTIVWMWWVYVLMKGYEDNLNGKVTKSKKIKINEKGVGFVVFNRGDTIHYWSQMNYGALLHSSMSKMDNTIQYHGGLQTRKFGQTPLC